MIVKDTFSIAACNFSLIFKIMIAAFILVLLFAAVFTGILSPLIEELGNALNIEIPIMGGAGGEGNPPIDGGAEGVRSITDLIAGLSAAIAGFFAANQTALWFAFAIVLIMVFLVRFFLGIVLLPVGKYIANKMTTGYSDGLYRTFIKLAGKSVALSFFSTLIFIICDVGVSALIIFVCALLGKSFGIFSIYIAMTALILWLSLRTALTAMWLPRIALGAERPLHALRSTLRDTKRTFVKTFTGALAIWAFVGLATAATFVFTLGFSFVIIIPLGIVLYITMTLVQYCHFYKQNYFKDDKTIVKVVETPVENQE